MRRTVSAAGGSEAASPGTRSDDGFPVYSGAETALDRIVHLIGVPAGIAASVWLIADIGVAGTTLVCTLLIYTLGLVGMLAASAAYNLARPSRRKELLRRADHAMIFVMIAASYTPFAVNVLPRRDSWLLGAAVWLLAAIGVCVTLIFPRRFERLLLALYLGMGWIVLSMIHTFIALLPHDVLLLLLSGGLAYSVGALCHSLRGMPFHNAVWHMLVLVGAGLHLAAMNLQFAAPA